MARPKLYERFDKVNQITLDGGEGSDGEDEEQLQLVEIPLDQSEMENDKLYRLSLSLDLDKSINDFITRLRQLLLSQFPAEVEVVAPTAVDMKVLTKYQDSLGLGAWSDSETQKFKRAFSLATAGWESTDSGYCPWVNPVGGPDPGWKLLLAILRSSTGTNGNAHQRSAYPSDTTTESIVSPMSLTTMDEENERQNDKDRRARIERLREMYIYRPRKPRKSVPGTSTIVR
ncbi:hypothetical protein V1525DRAFT_422220 [Lipomyces kononenkoae]|uniref:Uncharacterized protein n=1 Tax=Lipomyces kononenkoae TaxID=34357 RepID=A0ACC3SS56_LIPKO